jgi:serine/threonine protein kinase/Tol biopolymer transport system component
MSLAAGARLGAYEILAPIGAGGMGEVYRATDTRLGREVAIKIAKEQFSERFEREARAVAALNHPHICHLYDVGPNYLVMELVEGTPLKGPLPLEKAIEYAGQILDALDAAHKKGITHRDLKPANILVTKQGIKLLDFGLAKQTSPLQETDATRALTGKGQILGTLQYMSPEQLQGKEVDARSDLFSFGCVLYEMLTGKRAFEGHSAASVIAATMERPAPSIAEVAPPELDRVFRKCLAKDPDNRRQTARDLKDELEWIAQAPAKQAPTQASARRTWIYSASVAWAVAAVSVLAVLALAYESYHTREAAPMLRVSVVLPENVQVQATSPPAVSPDGRSVAFIAHADGKNSLWVRHLNTLTARALAGTDGADHPFWSPDSRFLAFFADGKRKKIDTVGGPAVTLCQTDPPGTARGGTWSKNGVILFAPNPVTGLFRVPASGGNLAPVVARGRFPWFLPDGHHFLYTRGLSRDGGAALYFADLDSKAQEQVLVADSNAVYALPGYVLFLRESTLMAQPFDADSGKTTGEAVPIAEQVDSLISNLQGQFSASLGPEREIVTYTSRSAQGVQLNWVDRSGKVTGTIGKPGYPMRPSISSDGSSVVVDRADTHTGVVDVWLLAGPSESRFTFDQPRNLYPIWSPDGNYIAYDSPRNGSRVGIFARAVKGSTGDVALAKPGDDPLAATPNDWSPDGRYIVASSVDPKTKSDLWELPWPPEQDGVRRKPIPYLRTPFNESEARVSANARWLAYASDESKQFEIYVQSFPVAGSKAQVSAHGGTVPVWSRDGKELFFIGADGKMMAADVNSGALKDQGAFQAGVPKALFDTHIPAGMRYDVSHDNRFLIPTPVAQPSGQITVVTNWNAGLKK